MSRLFRYTRAIEALRLTDADDLREEQKLALLLQADALDNRYCRLVEDARELAERCARMAKQLADGERPSIRVDMMAELDRDNAVYEATCQAYRGLVRMLCGAARAAEFDAELAK